MKIPAALLAAALGALAAAPSPAANAGADLLPGDRLHGDIAAPGDHDELRLWLPAGGTFDAEALAEKGSAILPSLEVLDPEGAALDLAAFSKPGPGGVGVKVKKAPTGPLGGVFTFRVIGGEGTSGKYSFKSKAKMPKSFTGTLELGAGGDGTLPFDAPMGSALSWTVKAAKGSPAEGLAMDGLLAPDESTVPLDGLTGKKLPLDQDGTWVLGVRNDGAAATVAEAKATLVLPKASKRELWLSPFGFGEAPKIATVTPNKILDDRVAEGIQVAGSGFDPGAAVFLERKNFEPLPATDFAVEGEAAITADFDPTAAAAGSWTLVVENPSGARGTKTLKIQAASNVELPRGLEEDTEVFWIDYDDDAFANDLGLVGLGSVSKSTRGLSMSAVKSYATFYLRTAFGIQGRTGKHQEDSVPVSFCVEEPPATVGAPGETYNRIRVGGAALAGDPSSNPFLPWGNGPLDTGNTAYENLVVDEGPGLGYRTAVLAPSLSTGLAEWVNVTAPLRSSPLTAADDIYYYPSFTPTTTEQAARYRDIVAATHAAGKEIGATLAHFVARSMGVADNISGLSYAPQKIGEYAAYSAFFFSAPEIALMKEDARPGLPGKSKTLEAGWFPPRETRPYLLPNATTTITYNEGFTLVGGRPDRASGDIVYDGASGVIPPGFGILTSGALVGNAPLRYGDGTLVGGVYRFTVRYRDTVADETYFFSHRLNLLVDVSKVEAAEVATAQTMNAQTLATP